MKKTLIALAALASTAAFAQSSVTISGSFDAGVGRTSTDAAATGVTTSGNPRNNITFSGTEDLGGGLKAMFGAQYRFNPATGKDSYDAPMEQVWLGLTGGFGTLKAGRFTGAFAGPENNFDAWGTDSAGVSLEGTARYNGQVAYYTPNFNGFTVGVQINPKANNTGALKDGSDFAVSYAAGAVTADVGYRDDTNKDKLTYVDGTYDMGVAKLGAGYVKTDVYNSAADRKQYAVNVTFPMGALALSAGYRNLQVDGDADLKRTAAQALYSLSKRTTVVGQIYSDSKTGKTYQTGYYAGLRHTF